MLDRPKSNCHFPVGPSPPLCVVNSTYLRPSEGIAVIPWWYGTILLLPHLPLLYLRIMKWQKGWWLALAMAIFDLSLTVVSYGSTDQEEVFVWT